jgi:hypothetical protein
MVKDHSVQQAQFLSSNHRAVLSWCNKALTFIELDNVIRQGFNVSFLVHHFVNSLLWQKCWGSRKRSHLSTLERFSTFCHTLQICTCSTPSRYNQDWSLLSACVQFQHYSLYCFGVIIDLQNLVKIKSAPWLFLVVYVFNCFRLGAKRGS